MATAAAVSQITSLRIGISCLGMNVERFSQDS
jgi:hypothetical protein